MEKEGLGVFCFGCEVDEDFLEGVGLLGVEGFGWVGEEGFVGVGVALDLNGFEGEESFFSEGLDWRGGTFTEFGYWESRGAGSLEKAEDGVLAGEVVAVGLTCGTTVGVGSGVGADSQASKIRTSEMDNKNLNFIHHLVLFLEGAKK